MVWHVQPCSKPKPELTLDLKIHPCWKLFFSKNTSLEFIPCKFIKNELQHRDYLAWVFKVPSLIFWKTPIEVSLLFLL